jgi:choline dehydrogenase
VLYRVTNRWKGSILPGMTGIASRARQAIQRGYESVFNIYRRIEDSQGAPDPDCRGTGGLLFIEPGLESDPIVPAILEGPRLVETPSFESANGRLIEGPGGCVLIEMRMRDWQRFSIFRSYTFPYMDRQNLTVLTYALVMRVLFGEGRVTGVELFMRAKFTGLTLGLRWLPKRSAQLSYSAQYLF